MNLPARYSITTEIENMPDTSDFDQLVRRLRKLGIPLPSDITASSLVHDLQVCLQQIKTMREADDDSLHPMEYGAQMSAVDDDPETARAIVDRQLSQYGGVGGCYRSRA